MRRRLDNSGDALTERLLRTYSDNRIHYVRAEATPDVISCWNQCVSLCRTPYLHLFSDDDRLHPAFLQHSMAFLESHPAVAYSFTHAHKTDELFRPLRLWGYDHPPHGVISGHDYLAFTYAHACCITLAPTVVIRTAIHNDIGPYRAVYARNTFDFNFYLRVALRHDVGFIAEPLVDYRLHSDQLTALHWRTPRLPTGKIGTFLELLGALEDWERAPDPPERDFARERRSYLLSALSGYLRDAIPEL